MQQLILDGHKLKWHAERVNAYLAGERVAPITIDMALTRKCNFKCVYCYGMLQDNVEEKITLPVVQRFLDDAAEIGVKAVSFVSDGESTCSPHLYDAVRYGKKKGLDMALGTNGALLKTGKDLEELLTNLTYLRFNISAATPERFAEIHGCSQNTLITVSERIAESVAIKNKNNLPVTIGMQMVLLPSFKDQILPLTKMAVNLGVDYLVIKHCSDDEEGNLGVDYSKYADLSKTLQEAESFSNKTTLIKAKWSKILSEGKRNYSNCYGPPLILQISGSGLVAPCGMLFNEKHNKYHIGNIAKASFKDLWQSEKYWNVMNEICSNKFDAKTMCGSLCLQHKVNEAIYELKENKQMLPLVDEQENRIQHVNFI